MVGQHLIPQNTLMGLPNEYQLTIIREALRSDHDLMIPLRALIDHDTMLSSPLAPFSADPHLRELALDVCFRTAIFTISFAELTDFPVSGRMDFLQHIRNLRITDDKPLAADRFSRSGQRWKTLLYRKMKVLLNLPRPLLPSLSRLDIQVLPDISDLPQPNPRTSITVRVALVYYYHEMFRLLKQAGWIKSRMDFEVRIVVVNSVELLSTPYLHGDARLVEHQLEKLERVKRSLVGGQPRVVFYCDENMSIVSWTEMANTLPMAAISWR